MKTTYITFILLSLGLFISCDKNSSSNSNNTIEEVAIEEELIVVSKKQFNNGRMELSSPQLHAFETRIQVNGKTQVPPTDRASLMAYAGGYIKSIQKQRGEYVQKGQVIASIENPMFIDLQKQYIETSKEVSVLKSELDRQTALFDEQISAKKTYERTKADYENHVVQLKSFEKELQLYGFSAQEVAKGNLGSVSYLKSPIHGVIEELNIHLGQYIGSEDKIATIIDTKNIHLELDIFEKDWYPLKEGQQVSFKFSDYDKDWHKAELEFIGKSVDATRRTVPVQAKVIDTIDNLVPGIFIDAEIRTDSKSTWALPETGFAQNEQLWYVLKLANETEENYSFKLQKVTIEQEDHAYKSFTQASIDTTAVYLSKGIFTIIDFD